MHIRRWGRSNVATTSYSWKLKKVISSETSVRTPHILSKRLSSQQLSLSLSSLSISLLLRWTKQQSDLVRRPFPSKLKPSQIANWTDGDLRKAQVNVPVTGNHSCVTPHRRALQDTRTLRGEYAYAGDFKVRLRPWLIMPKTNAWVALH